MRLPQSKRVWIGGAGVGIELIFVAAVALGLPSTVWVVPLFLGLLLIAYATLVGEPSGADRDAVTVQSADGGRGDGHVRGNVFRDNVTINIGDHVPPPVPLEERSMVRVSVTDLLSIGRGHTQVQAEKLADPYIGGWITIKGTVDDVTRQTLGEGYQVSVKVEGEEIVFAQFPEDAQEELPRLRRNDSIEVTGRITQIAANWLSLEECEFVD